MATWPVEQKSTTMGENTLKDLSEGLGGGTTLSTVAATGSVIGDAAALAIGFNLVTGADGTKGVILPVAAAGKSVRIKNNTNAVLKVWPQSGAAINALTASSAMSLAALVSAVFDATSATQWFTTPLLPS